MRLVIAGFLQVLCGPGTENWQSDDCVSAHHSSIFNEHAVDDAHPELPFQHVVDMFVKGIEAVVDVLALPLVPIVEGNLL